MNINFFKAIAASEILKDKESLEMKLVRTGDEFTVMVIPKLENKKTIYTLVGTPEEIDESFISELNKPAVKMRAFTSSANEATIEEEAKDTAKTEVPSKIKPKKKAEETSKTTETKPEENKEEQDNKALFNQALLDGDNFYKERKYIEAEQSYKKACDLFPDNKKAEEIYQKTFKYVNALINAKILKPREEWGKEEQNGTESN